MDRGELMSEGLFRIDEKKVMTERIMEQRRVPGKIEKKTKKMDLVLRRQMLIRHFNMHKDDLRNCNLEHVAGVVAAMVKLNGEIGEEVIASSSSSGAQSGEER
jgi:hypothetical protein